VSIQKIRADVAAAAESLSEFIDQRGTVDIKIALAFEQARAALALLDDLAKVDERALEAGAQAAAALRMIGSAGRLNDPDVSEMFRERIRAETRAAIAAYLAALTETKK